MTTRITREMLRDWGACYDDDHIAALVPPEGVTPIQVLDADIPASDRLWVLLHEEIIPAREIRLLAVRWARDALSAERSAGREPAPESWAACDVAERHARGEATDEELAAAEAAARAAWAAAWAADAAARSAAAATVQSVDLAAAGAAAAAAEAAKAAAWSAAGWSAGWSDRAAAAAAANAADAVVRAAQIEDVRRVLTGGEP